MPDNKNVPGAKPGNPASPGRKSWQEQLTALKASGVARGSGRATSGSAAGALDLSGGAMDAAKNIFGRARALVQKGFDAVWHGAGGRGSIERGLIVGGLIVALLAVAYLVGIPQWLKQRKENRQWTVVNNLTPDRLLRRCGKPLSDETRDIYPVIARDIRYEAEPSGTVVLKFSRTAEESSDWVFMSMQDASSGATYDTPIAKITALSCLDSSK
jgi:hypothetical protein